MDRTSNKELKGVLKSSEIKAGCLLAKFGVCATLLRDHIFANSFSGEPAHILPSSKTGKRGCVHEGERLVYIDAARCCIVIAGL